MLSSILLGTLFLSCLFLICLFSVVGIKYFIILLTKEPEPLPKKRRRRVKKEQKSVRSIQIDPDEIDRIYVGKVQ